MAAIQRNGCTRLAPLPLVVRQKINHKISYSINDAINWCGRSDNEKKNVGLVALQSVL